MNISTKDISKGMISIKRQFCKINVIMKNKFQ